VALYRRVGSLPMKDSERVTRRQSFGTAAGEYDRLRPTHPAEALRWALGERPLRVVDLGAGTGILTRVLLALGHHVTAAEPDGRMRAHLERVSPQVTTLDGRAERIRCPTASRTWWWPARRTTGSTPLPPTRRSPACCAPAACSFRSGTSWICRCRGRPS